MNERQLERSEQVCPSVGSRVTPVTSDLSAFGQFQSVFDINAEVADGTLDLRMAEKDLYRAQVGRRLLDDQRLGAIADCGAPVVAFASP